MFTNESRALCFDYKQSLNVCLSKFFMNMTFIGESRVRLLPERAYSVQCQSKSRNGSIKIYGCFHPCQDRDTGVVFFPCLIVNIIDLSLKLSQ